MKNKAMDEEHAVLFANEAFYQAFTEGDVAGMDEIWARDAEIFCIHPGWAPLSGRDEVMQSWRAILENPNAPSVEFSDARVSVEGILAFVVGYESVGEGHLAATNIFTRENGLWKMVHHNTGPTSGVPKGAERPKAVRRPQTMH
ncbi:MAG: nuclear transport factor 2 family protein [Proteobacteria bacterium]|nr:nuclear transport factor 2 family protein [Pseudomonadota bacterium]